MARPRKKPLVVEDESFPSADELELEEFLEAVGHGTNCIDIIRHKSNGERPQLDRVGMDVVREDPYAFLRETYGPGKYQLNFLDSSKKYRASRIFHVEGKPNTPGAVDSVMVRAHRGDESATEMHLQFMREQMTQQQTLLQTMIAAMRPPDLAPMATVIAAALGANKGGSDSGTLLSSVVAAFAALKTTAGNDGDWIAKAKTIIELGKDLNPNSGEPSMWGVVHDIGNKLVNKLETGRGSPGPPLPDGGFSPRALVESAPALSPISPPDRTSAPTERPALNPSLPSTVEDWIRVQLGVLKQKASNGKDVELWIDYILENQEEPGCGCVAGAIRQGATFENLLQFDVEIGQNPALKSWFKTLYDGLYAELRAPTAESQPSVDAPVDTAGSRGNADYTGDHEGSRVDRPKRLQHSPPSRKRSASVKP